MRKTILIFFKIYLLYIVIFILQKPLFMMYYHELYKGIHLYEYFTVMLHGLKLDASVAGYLTILPGLFLIVSLWVKPKFMTGIERIYFAFISVAISIIFVSDLGLYHAWGFRLDATPLLYIRYPKDAMASVNWPIVLAGVISIILISIFLYFVFEKLIVQ